MINPAIRMGVKVKVLFSVMNRARQVAVSNSTLSTILKRNCLKAMLFHSSVERGSCKPQLCGRLGHISLVCFQNFLNDCFFNVLQVIGFQLQSATAFYTGGEDKMKSSGPRLDPSHIITARSMEC